MYTEEMSKAFHAIEAPKNFGVSLADAGDWINIIVDPESVMKLQQSELEDAVKYINDVKKALEQSGAIVQIVREAVSDE